MLVPNKESKEKYLIIDAIGKIITNPPEKIKDIDLIDYTVDSNRRYIASINQIRVSTFHSARGIEAHRVLLFGFEKIGHKNKGVIINSLGYISLSRSLFELLIVVRDSQNSNFIRFLEKTLAKLSIHKYENQYNQEIISPNKNTKIVTPNLDDFQIPKINNKEVITVIEKLFANKNLNQRNKLEKIITLKADITSLDPQFKAAVKKEIKKKINSPKLRHEVDLFIKGIENST